MDSSSKPSSARGPRHGSGCRSTAPKSGLRETLGGGRLRDQMGPKCPHRPIRGAYDDPMQTYRKASFAAATLLVLALPLAAGCSNSGSSATTTTATSNPAGSSTTTSGVPSLPATGSVDGFTMAVTSSPATGTIGHTVIRVKAVLTGTVQAGTLNFQVSDQPSAQSGKAKTSQNVPIHKVGTYTMPVGYRPNAAGSWAVTVTFTPASATASKLSVSGLPPVAGGSAPFPQLVTIVTAG
jgi:hypothetical protein